RCPAALDVSRGERPLDRQRVRRPGIHVDHAPHRRRADQPAQGTVLLGAAAPGRGRGIHVAAAGAAAVARADPRRLRDREVRDRELVGLAVRRELRPPRLRRSVPAPGAGPGGRVRARPLASGASRRSRHGGRAAVRALDLPDAAVLARRHPDERRHVGSVQGALSEAMVNRRLVTYVFVACAAAAVLAYLRDPPWLISQTSGLHGWERPPGMPRYRWSGGPASFFVGAAAGTFRIPAA